MKNEYLKRITFLGENKMMVDGEHEVTIKKGENKKFIFNGKNGKKGFSTEEELFDYVDVLTHKKTNMLYYHSKTRRNIYKEQGFEFTIKTISLP